MRMFSYVIDIMEIHMQILGIIRSSTIMIQSWIFEAPRLVVNQRLLRVYKVVL